MRDRQASATAASQGLTGVDSTTSVFDGSSSGSGGTGSFGSSFGTADSADGKSSKQGHGEANGMATGMMVASRMRRKAMKLKMENREISERKQVGDAEEMMETGEGAKNAWWRNVSMEEGV